MLLEVSDASIFCGIIWSLDVYDSNFKFRNSGRVRHWLALSPALSQNWEREPETPLSSPAPLLPILGEGEPEMRANR
jgi:hypothetical protein